MPLYMYTEYILPHLHGVCAKILHPQPLHWWAEPVYMRQKHALSQIYRCITLHRVQAQGGSNQSALLIIPSYVNCKHALFALKRRHRCPFCPSGSKEGSGDRQMTPELLNEAFSAKAEWQKPWKHRKQPYDTLFWCTNEVCSNFMVTDRHTDKTTTITLPAIILLIILCCEY